MELNNGWIKLHRKFINWEWYKDKNTKIIFIHFLLLANHKEKKWQGQIIQTGQFITGLKSLSNDLGLSQQSIRTSINKLKLTQEITIKSTNKFSLVTIIKWEEYQDKENKSTNKSTNEQQTNNKQLTTNKNDKNEKNEKNIDIFFENDLFNQSWLDFKEMRVKLKKPMTEKSETLILNKLHKLTDKPEEANKILEQSILNSWKGVFPLSRENETLDKEAQYAKDLYEKYGDNAIHYFTEYPLNNALKYKFLLNF